MVFGRITSAIRSVTSTASRAVSSTASRVSTPVRSIASTASRTVSRTVSRAASTASRTVSSAASTASRTVSRAAGSASGAAGSVVRSVAAAPVVVPKVALSQVQKITAPIQKIPLSVAAAGGAVISTGAAASEMIKSGGISSASLPSMPSILDPIKGAGAGAGAMIAGGGIPLGSLPALPAVRVPALSDMVDGISGRGPSVDLSGAGLGVNPGWIPPGGNIIDGALAARDHNYDEGFSRFESGDRLGGAAQVGAMAAADIILPTYSANVGNKILTGRRDELTGSDYLWAGIEVIGYGLAIPTGGGSLLAMGALRGAKVAKVAGAAKGASGGGDMFKVIGKIGSKAGSMGAGAVKTSQAAQAARATQAAQAGRAAQAARATQAAQAGRAAQVTRAAKSAQVAAAAKAAQIAQGARAATAVRTAKLAQAAKTTNLKKVGLLGAGAGAGIVGISMMGAPAAAASSDTFDPYVDPGMIGPMGGGGFDGPIDWGDQWWDDLFPPPGGDPYLDPETGEYVIPPGGGYYDPEYPFGEYVWPAEVVAQDGLGFLEGIPLIGDVAGAIRRSGYAGPIMLIGGVVVLGLGYKYRKKIPIIKDLVKKR